MVTAHLNLTTLVSFIGQNLREHRAWLRQETKIHDAIEQALIKSGIQFSREFNLTTKDRLDFWLPDRSLAVEVKKRKITEADLRQVGRYLQDARVAGCIVVAPRAEGQPSTLLGKPVTYLTYWKFLL